MTRTLLRKGFLALGAAAALLLTLILARTVSCGSARPALEALPDFTVSETAAGRLAGSLRFATVSHEDPSAFDAEAFRGLHAHLEAAFPRVHAQLRRETIASHSLVR